jgi:hypothetical protein
LAYQIGITSCILLQVKAGNVPVFEVASGTAPNWGNFPRRSPLPSDFNPAIDTKLRPIIASKRSYCKKYEPAGSAAVRLPMLLNWPDHITCRLRIDKVVGRTVHAWN